MSTKMETNNGTSAVKESLKDKYYLGRAAIVLAVMIGVTGFVILSPDTTKELGNKIFMLSTGTLGSSVMAFIFIYFILMMWLSFSKYGNIRFGSDKPEYSTFSWFAMLFCSSSATAAAYWAFNEWPALYTYMENAFATGGGANALGGMLTTAGKVELARAYNFVDWGPVMYGIQSLACVPMAYYFYNRKEDSWAFETSCKRVVKSKKFGSFVSIFGLIATFAALGYTSSIGVDLISVPLCYALGIEPTFTFKVVMMVLISMLFTLTSYMGLGKGMKRISNLGAYVSFGLCIYILLFSGYGIDILDSTLSSLGLAANNYIRFSTWIEPYQSSGFAQNWPIFYGFSFAMYAPFVGVFIGKISKGRTIRQVALVSVFGAFAGLLVIHGVIGGLVAELMFDGTIDVLGLAVAGNGPELVIQTLMALPGGKIVIIVFAIMAILFLATTLDAGASTLANGIKRSFKDGKEATPLSRFIWCVAIAGFPLALVAINADIPTIKSLTMIVTIPVFFMIAFQTISFFKDLKDDHGKKSAQTIIDEWAMDESAE